MKIRQVFLSLVLSLSILALLCPEPVQARPSRGGRSGSYQRQGTRTRTNADGQARTRSQQGQGTWQRNSEGGSRTYNGTVTGANGREGQVERNSNWNRTENGRERNWEHTTTAPNGQERTVEGTSTTTHNGDGTYDRDSSRTVTGPNGESRTSTASGSGTVNRTEDGVTRSYQGTQTNSNGDVFDVNRDGQWTRNGDGTVTESRSHQVTDSQGQMVRSGESTGTWTQGQGGERNSTYSNRHGSGNRNARWVYQDGRWVRQVQGQNANGSTVEGESSVEVQKGE